MNLYVPINRFQQLSTHGQSYFICIPISFLIPHYLETNYRHYVISSKMFHVVFLKHKVLSENHNYSIEVPKNIRTL